MYVGDNKGCLSSILVLIAFQLPFVVWILIHDALDRSALGKVVATFAVAILIAIPIVIFRHYEKTHEYSDSKQKTKNLGVIEEIEKEEKEGKYKKGWLDYAGILLAIVFFPVVIFWYILYKICNLLENNNIIGGSGIGTGIGMMGGIIGFLFWIYLVLSAICGY